ncbi:MAG: carbon storage regulator [Caulobacteraceae bacterium]
MLTRKKDESIIIGDGIEIVITEICEDKVKIGIVAPKNVKVFRKELLQEVEKANAESNTTNAVDVAALSKMIKK